MTLSQSGVRVFTTLNIQWTDKADLHLTFAAVDLTDVDKSELLVGTAGADAPVLGSCPEAPSTGQPSHMQGQKQGKHMGASHTTNLFKRL